LHVFVIQKKGKRRSFWEGREINEWANAGGRATFPLKNANLEHHWKEKEEGLFLGGREYRPQHALCEKEQTEKTEDADYGEEKKVFFSLLRTGRDHGGHPKGPGAGDWGGWGLKVRKKREDNRKLKRSFDAFF